MEVYGVKRVISLTGSDALANGDRLNVISRMFHLVIKLTPARRILADGERHISMLEGSQLTWTVLRSPIMNNKGDPKLYSLSDAKPKPWATINRQSVARAMVEAIDKPEYYRRAPFVIRGDAKR